MQGSRSTPNPLQTGLEWQAKGWGVTPIPYREKEPPRVGTTGAEGTDLSGADLWDIAEHGTHNWALRLGVHMVGIDVDDYNGKDGMLTFDSLEDRYGSLPLTYVITSREPGTSGVRLYSCPVEPDRQGLGRGVDVIRHSHRYVMGPGSVHPDTGQPYRLYRETPDGWVEVAEAIDLADPSSLPGRWVDLMGQREERAPGEGVEALPEGEECAELVRLSTVDPGAGSRHDAWASAVFNVVGKAAQGHTGALGVLARMRREFHDAIGGDRPVYSEFDRMVEGAKAKARPAEETCLGAGCHRDAWIVGEPIRRQDDPDTQPALDPLRYTRNTEHLGGLEMPALRWAVPNLIPEGLTIVAGAPKVGKSWLALDVALAVATGGKAMDALPAVEGDVLYVAMEDGERRLKERLGLLLGGAGWATRMHYCVKMPEEYRHDLIGFAEAWRKSVPDPRLVVADTIGRIRPPKRDRDADAYREDYAFLARWQEWALSSRLGLLGVHHTRKATADYFVEEVSGTNGLAGAADVVAVLSRPKNAQLDGVLKVTARDFPEADLSLTKAGPVWQVYDGPLVNPDLSGDMDYVVQTVLAAGPTGITARTVISQTGLNANTVYQYLARAVESGLIQKMSRGRYVAPL